MHLGIFNDLKVNSLALDYLLVIIPKFMGIQTVNEQAVAASQAVVKKILGEYEQSLKGKRYFIGDALSILDIIFFL
jgi:glutathione S-transferase